MVKTKHLAFGLSDLLLCCWIALTSAASRSHPPTVLAIGADNGWTNWTAVETFAQGRWNLQGADLDGFGDVMQKQGFQTALNHFDSRLSRLIKVLQPSAIIVCSKGLNVLTHLINEGIWKGPSVLLSPIPNDSTHNPGDSWESQWTSSMNTLVSMDIAPIAIGVGTSLDEETLILDMMEGTNVCGSMNRNRVPKTFDKCPSWSLYSFPGNHSWNKKLENAENIALLIDEALNQQGMPVEVAQQSEL